MKRTIAIGGSVPIALVALLLSADMVNASSTPCFDPNNGVGASQYVHTSANGSQGNVDLTPATPFQPSATGIIHPAQIAMASGDFVGWGTHNGVGTSGGITNCATYTGSLWILYVDGTTFGQYFCRATYGSEPATANNQHWEIRYTTCSGSTRWAFYWNGTQKTCETVNDDHGVASVGSESLGYDPQNLKVHYDALTYHVSSWANWTSSSYCVNSWYKATINSVTDILFGLL